MHHAGEFRQLGKHAAKITGLTGLKLRFDEEGQ